MDEFAVARGQVFCNSSELEDVKAELGDLQRQFDEAMHEISDLKSEVQIYLFSPLTAIYVSFFLR